jgi:exopolysaccharide biosynthesis polyprenyl glycosylphosphotransferase
MRPLYRIKQLILIIGDILIFFFGFGLSLTIRYREIPSQLVIERHIGIFIVVFFLWLIINYISGLYNPGRPYTIRFLSRRILETASIALVVSVIFFYLFSQNDITPKTILVLAVLFSYLLLAFWRIVYTFFIGTKRLKTGVIFVGWSRETKELLHILNQNQTEYKVLAIIDPEKKILSKEMHPIDVYHGLHTLRPAITTHKAQLVVIAPHLQKQEAALRELYELLFWPVQLHDLPTFYEMITGRIPPITFSEGWFLEHLRDETHPGYSMAHTFITYGTGLILGIILLVITLPAAIIIKLSSKGPVFIKQKRIGRYGKQFTLYKFRSMYALSSDGTAEIKGVQFAIKNDARVTPVGRFLRKTRLDELPQVLNLLKRELALIGPRPERPQIVEQLTEKMPYYPLRHLIRPGITGWAVLHQNYTDDLETSLQKLQYDLYYIKNRSFMLDLSILLRTINVVIRMKGQ